MNTSPALTTAQRQNHRPVDAIAIVGPTASGKTAAALALAQSLQPQGGAEIISVDSALVYRGMDIGTAKPSRDELAAVPHHLIDTLDPLQSYSAAEFAKDATRLIRDIRARGKTPLRWPWPQACSPKAAQKSSASTRHWSTGAWTSAPPNPAATSLLPCRTT